MVFCSHLQEAAVTSTPLGARVTVKAARRPREALAAALSVGPRAFRRFLLRGGGGLLGGAALRTAHEGGTGKN